MRTSGGERFHVRDRVAALCAVTRQQPGPVTMDCVEPVTRGTWLAVKVDVVTNGSGGRGGSGLPDREPVAMEVFEAAPPGGGPSLALHGGAGGRVDELARAPYEQGLLAAYRGGWQVLAAGGGAPD